jgi:hypothetical protein
MLEADHAPGKSVGRSHTQSAFDALKVDCKSGAPQPIRKGTFMTRDHHTRRDVARRVAEAVFAGTLFSTALVSGTVFIATPPAMALPDTDNDGIEDWREQRSCTDETKADTDFDVLSDGEEVNKTGTDPCNVDTDGDRVHDGRELQLGIDPLNADTDGDGRNDGQEHLVDNTNPRVPDTPGTDGNGGGEQPRQDSDGDGMFDDDEINGHNNCGCATEPNNPDTDGDGVNDGAEDDNGTDPLDPNDN